MICTALPVQLELVHGKDQVFMNDFASSRTCCRFQVFYSNDDASPTIQFTYEAHVAGKRFAWQHLLLSTSLCALCIVTRTKGYSLNRTNCFLISGFCRNLRRAICAEPQDCLFSPPFPTYTLHCPQVFCCLARRCE